MRPLLAIVLSALVLGGCGATDPAETAAGSMRAAPESRPAEAPAAERRPASPRAAPRGTTIRLRSSAFGRILFDGRRQAIYVFQNDRRNRTTCYGQCARDWPPVLTRGRPRAAGGVDAALLGTIRRRDGTRQVTYAGRPLYFYANEGPGEVRCHNVNLNGGLWWVVGRDGRRRP